MTKRGKVFMIVVAIIAVLFVISSIILANIIQKERKEIGRPVQSVDETNKYVKILADGTKENNSEELNKDKVFDELNITNIKLKENNQLTKLTATITNNTDKIKGDYTADIIFLDSEGNELSKMGIYIKELKPGESTMLNSSIVFDYSNAYNIIFRK